MGKRLEKNHRYEKNKVRVRKANERGLVKPLFSDPARGFAELDRLRAQSFFPKRRNQPLAPRREVFK